MRFSISRLIHGIAIKTSGGQRLSEKKEHFFRAAISMSEEGNWMRTRSCREKSKRGCVCSQHYFFDAYARLDHAREYSPKNQGGDGCGSEAMVSAIIHSIQPPNAKVSQCGEAPLAAPPGSL